MKKFQDYLEKRLNGNEIAELELQAKLEYQFLYALQHDVADAVASYMNEEKIGFNELAR